MIWLIPTLVALASANAGAASIDERVFRGWNSTNIIKFPHQAWITDKVDGCGGSILTHKHILTTATCLNKLRPLAMKVHVGSSDISKIGQGIKVEKVRVCPFFNSRTGDCDAAVLALECSIDYNKLVRPIKLINVKDKPKVGDVLTVTGWGVSTTGRGYTDTLHALDIVYMDMAECRKKYKEQQQTIGESLFCARSKDQGAQYIVGNGFSGGPVINNQKQLVGIVSKGLRNLPPLYTDITNFKVRSFIGSSLTP